MTATSCPAEKTDLGRNWARAPFWRWASASTVGFRIFSSLSEVAGAAGSSLFPVLAFVIGGLLQIPADFCCAELASACLEDGGQYVYFREADPLVLLYVGEAEPEGSLIPA